ncbi:hypothetical protein BKA70DRAFT_1236772 [Coprinopsis sp. MPI-PUGE-AT-0042]|nr:hypothetical protein BKA70DRAFT_1236772 [Coprinopsis sp. MPI-PUGE-AT-0042]
MCSPGISTLDIKFRYSPSEPILLRQYTPLAGSTTHFRTEDRGKTWRSFDTPSAPALTARPLSFHSGPNKFGDILFRATHCDGSGWGRRCHDVTRYTTDAFSSIPKGPLSYTNRCQLPRSSKEFKHETHEGLAYYSVAFDSDGTYFVESLRTPTETRRDLSTTNASYGIDGIANIFANAQEVEGRRPQQPPYPPDTFLSTGACLSQKRAQVLYRHEQSLYVWILRFRRLRQLTCTHLRVWLDGDLSSARRESRAANKNLGKIAFLQSNKDSGTTLQPSALHTKLKTDSRWLRSTSTVKDNPDWGLTIAVRNDKDKFGVIIKAVGRPLQCTATPSRPCSWNPWKMLMAEEVSRDWRESLRAAAGAMSMWKGTEQLPMYTAAGSLCVFIAFGF